MTRRVLFIGEQPSKPGAIAFNPYGDTTKRLAKSLDMDSVVMRNTFRFANLLPWGVKWTTREAAAAARAFEQWVDYDGVDGLVLLGKRVQEAFGYKFNGPFRAGSVWDKINGRRVRVLLLPHPSGVNRWWNSFENREHGRTLLRRIKRWALS